MGSGKAMAKRVAQADTQSTSLLIVAGGSGTYGCRGAKQYLPLRGVPILVQTIRNIQVAFGAVPETILVVPESDIASRVLATSNI